MEINSNLYSYGISSLSSIYSSLYSSSSTTSTASASISVSGGTDSYQISDEARSMAAASRVPDFDSMSDDDFRGHVSSISDKLTEQGFDVSDIDNMSSEELASLKEEMVAYGAENKPQGPGGKQGPPPPQDATSTTSTSLE